MYRSSSCAASEATSGRSHDTFGGGVDRLWRLVRVAVGCYGERIGHLATTAEIYEMRSNPAHYWNPTACTETRDGTRMSEQISADLPPMPDSSPKAPKPSGRHAFLKG